MKKIKILSIVIGLFVGLFSFSQIANAESLIKDIDLPAPNVTGGTPIMEALGARKNSEKFSKKPLDLQTLSDLLWAADGINRNTGRRTAEKNITLPVLTVYAAFPEGIYKYDPQANKLVGFSREDVRPIVGKYPMVLIYVANLGVQSKFLAAVDCGFIAQNVYLFSAANRLNTKFLYSVNTSALGMKLNLKLTEDVLFAQIVGYPPESD